MLSDGANTEVAAQLHAGLIAQGAVPRFLGVKLGSVEGTSGSLDVEATLEIMPAVLWDGAIVLDGPTPSLCESGQAVEFIKAQYRPCKPILLFDGAAALLAKLSLPDALTNGPVDGSLRGFSPSNSLCQKSAALQELEPPVAVLFTAAAWLRKRAASVAT